MKMENIFDQLGQSGALSDEAKKNACRSIY